MERTDAIRKKEAEYARQWRAKNLERAREIARQSRARVKERDPEAFAAAQRARYRRFIERPGEVERQRERSRRQRHRWNLTRRGLSKQDRHDYWLARDGLCDLCSAPYPDPNEKGAGRFTVIDHDRSHCSNKIGCIDCVRGQGHRVCNVVEGNVAKALALGVIASVPAPLSDYLADPPFQRWRRELS